MKVQIKIFADPECSSCDGTGLEFREYLYTDGWGNEHILGYPPTMCACTTSETVGSVIMEDGDEDRVMGKVLE